MNPAKTTTVKIPQYPFAYDCSCAFVSLGSCFAREIGDRLETHCIKCLTNPLGTVYNPLALSELMMLALRKQTLNEDSFFLSEELWRHHLVHESHASISKDQSIQVANQQIERLSLALHEADCLILTLGTAWSYRLKSDHAQVIGHNHKLPLNQFVKSLLPPEEIAKSLSDCLTFLHDSNSRIQVIITVSPVKHLRDGLHENNLSKSTLLLACASLAERFDRVHYFPAFEILQDELRDYRFYAEDMAHPSRLTSNYIWQQFQTAAFKDTATSNIKEVRSILTSLNHRPIHPETNAYAMFKKSISARIEKLKAEGLDVAKLQLRFENLP